MVRSFGGIVRGGSCVDGGASTSSGASASESSCTTSLSELESDVAGLLDPDLRLLGADLADTLGLAAGRGGLNAFPPVGRAGGMATSNLSSKMLCEAYFTIG